MYEILLAATFVLGPLSIITSIKWLGDYYIVILPYKTNSKGSEFINGAVGVLSTIFQAWYWIFQ